METKTHRIFGGITLIILAIILIISKLGYLNDFGIWSLLFTIFLIYVIIKSIYPINFGGIFFPIAFLCIIYDKQLNIEELTPWTVLIVAALGTIGLSMIFHGRERYSSHKKIDNYNFDVIDSEDESNVVQKTSFGATTKYINSENFKQADFDCNVGAMEIYFDKANVKEGKAIVRINAYCSGVNLYVPKKWNVENHLEVFLSGVDQKNENEPDGLTTLVLIGNIKLSAVEIIFV